MNDLLTASIQLESFRKRANAVVESSSTQFARPKRQEKTLQEKAARKHFMREIRTLLF